MSDKETYVQCPACEGEGCWSAKNAPHNQSNVRCSRCNGSGRFKLENYEATGEKIKSFLIVPLHMDVDELVRNIHSLRQQLAEAQAENFAMKTAAEAIITHDDDNPDMTDDQNYYYTCAAERILEAAQDALDKGESGV